MIPNDAGEAVRRLTDAWMDERTTLAVLESTIEEAAGSFTRLANFIGATSALLPESEQKPIREAADFAVMATFVIDSISGHAMLASNLGTGYRGALAKPTSELLTVVEFLRGQIELRLRVIGAEGMLDREITRDAPLERAALFHRGIIPG